MTTAGLPMPAYAAGVVVTGYVPEDLHQPKSLQVTDQVDDGRAVQRGLPGERGKRRPRTRRAVVAHEVLQGPRDQLVTGRQAGLGQRPPPPEPWRVPVELPLAQLGQRPVGEAVSVDLVDAAPALERWGESVSIQGNLPLAG